MIATTAGSHRRFLAGWCGWVLTVTAGLTPLIAWLWPLGFAGVVGVAGLLCLPALRPRRGALALGGVVLGLLVWAVVSSAWSPFSPRDLGHNTAAKLVLQTVLYGGFVAAAAGLDGRARRRSLRVLGVAVAVLALLTLIEAVTQAGLYRAIRAAIGDPLLVNFAVKNVAQCVFVLALLGWNAVLGLPRAARGWAAAAMVVAVAVGGVRLAADAPIIAMIAGLMAVAVTRRWPKGGPRVMAAAAAAAMLAAPLLVWWANVGGLEDLMRLDILLSWRQRLGYWNAAVELIAHHPLRGWGLDASRSFSPVIRLHPHDAALQIWLELGAVGAGLAAAFWGLVLAGLRRARADLAVAAAAATAIAYFTFGAVSFGVWQEWWLALGAMAAAFSLMALRELAAPASTSSPPSE